MSSAANSHVEMAKVSRRVHNISIRGSRSFHAETKSNQQVYIDMTQREKSDNKHPNFFKLLHKNKFI